MDRYILVFVHRILLILSLIHIYWYRKQSVEMGWSSNVLKMQIEINLYDRQIKSNKVNNFTATLPAPQSDLAKMCIRDRVCTPL